MIQYPQIDPVLLSLGPVKIHWYGVTYLAGFVIAWYLCQLRAKKSNGNWTADQVSDLIFYGAIGVVLGGRMGYVLFYNFGQFLDNPLWLLQVWTGGMSFHGGLLGVLIAMWLFCRKVNKSWFEVMDFVAPVVPVGLATGRIGNFINAELWGRVSDVPWAISFPYFDQVTGQQLWTQPRHPSQLYEFFLEGVLLFLILWIFSAKKRPLGAVTSLFAIGYAIFRIFVEFFRKPDDHLGFLAFDWLTMGQLLSLPLLLVGLFFFIRAYRQEAL